MMAFVAGALGVFLFLYGSVEGQEAEGTEGEVEEKPVEIEYPEHGSGAVAVYTAVDPEGKDVTWGLTMGEGSEDAEHFEINEGRLTFKTPPDYEDPAGSDEDSPGGSAEDNVYKVVIEARDVDAGLEGEAREDTDRPVTKRLRVIVTNVEEPGEVEFSTLQPQEGVEIRATLTDPDGRPGGDGFNIDLTAEEDGTKTTWQWSRSTRMSGRWTDIEDDEGTTDIQEGKESSYTPTKDDVGMYLRATATYNDGHCATCEAQKTAQTVSANPVQADPSNKAPRFLDENGNALMSATRSVAENSEGGTPVGEPVTATDPGLDGRQETLTYDLSGADGRSFDIDAGTGQIRVKDDLNYEDPAGRSHQVTVSATDPSGGRATIFVTITVTNVDEAPRITAGRTSVDYKENTSAGTEVSRYTAEDPDGDASASLKWSLSGRDADKFAIGNREGEHGRLTFRDVPDYETARDSDRDNVYEVTVEVRDRGGSEATRAVTVHVENEDELGSLTVSTLHPQVGTRVTPTLTDPDTPISNLIWTWRIDDDVESRASAYTPKAADVDGSLEVSVTYTDGTGERQTLSVESLSNVRERPSRNQDPRFPASTPSRLTVRENEERGEDVGGPVVAEDPDNDDLTYSISSEDSAFSIDQDTGQITTRTSLDREKKSSYRVTVTAEDPSGERDTHSLIVTVGDDDEPPVITSGDVYIYYAENDRGNVTVYRAEDPEGRTIDWSLTGDDAERFTLSRGVLRFKTPPPDHEVEDEYTVTVNAGDGNGDNTDTEEVTISIINVDEEGEVTFSHEPREGNSLTAELTDPDGGESGREWQWARASSRSGRFTDIPDAIQASYTPVNDDTGMYLRATVTYTDAQGGGKSAYYISQDRTQWKLSGPPQFLDSDGEDEEATTREVMENARPGTNIGAPVAATDIGDRGIPENLTYELSGTDSNPDDFKSFEIDQRTGQLKVKRGTTLDYEVKGSYVVKITAKDPSDRTGSESRDDITVTINVIDVNETPKLTLQALESDVFTGDLISGFTYPEPVGGDETELRLVFMGDDPEAGPAEANLDIDMGTTANVSTLNWTLAGTDADDFNISDGTLTFKNKPDYEAPTDSGRNNIYEVTVQVTDEAGNTASERVKITVENVDEDGVVTLSHTQPEVGARLAASLTDPDTARNVRWKWYRVQASSSHAQNELMPLEQCSDATPTDCLIPRATSSNYVPVDGDVNNELIAMASYSDREGSGKAVFARTSHAVREKPVNNEAPRFLDGSGADTRSYERAVREDVDPTDTDALPVVGDPVMATDTDPLVYSLSSGDVRYFTINQDTGQIEVGAGTELDYETKKEYRVTVRAVDPSGASKTVTVTIDVTNVDETPTLSRKELVAVGRGTISYEENGRNTVAEYSVLGSNAGSVSWRLTGPDASDFSISSGGALTFRSRPNFEAPADSDRDNTYELTVTARSSREQDGFDVTVDVFNVNEEGEVTLSPTRGNIGALITAELTDPDGTPTNVRWEWARSEGGIAGWTPIPGTNSDRYTLDAEDRGYYLQATARYTDPEGGGKSASARTTAVVRADDDGRVTLTPARAEVGTTVAARLTDPDGGVTNVTWQWARSLSGSSGWSDIPGATSSTYTTVESDLDSFLRVTARYDDGDGTDKAANAVTTTAIVADDDGVVTLSPAGPSVGEAVRATLTDPDGGVSGATWQWAASPDGTSNWAEIAGATSETYTVAAGDLGKFLRATVSYGDAVGAGKGAEAITAAAITVDDDGTVTLSPSRPQVGDRVTAQVSDPDGGVAIETWEWATSPNGTSNWVMLFGANSSTFTAAAPYEGSYLRATAIYTDAGGPGKRAEGVTAAAVMEDDDGMVTLSTGTPEVGSAITAMLTDPDGGVTGATWQWEKSSNGVTGWRDIQGATSASYTPGRSDVGGFLRATVSYDDAVGTGKSAESASSSGVAQMQLLSQYDANGNGGIDKGEAIDAVRDYFGDQISKDNMLAVLALYFSG